MVAKIRIYGIIIMSLILIFSFIHLGVGIAIISKDRSYSGIFHPEIGLAAANIVISFFGILVGTIGLFCILTNQKLLSKIVTVISGIVGIFALASLITAIILNSKSVSDVNTRFFNNMNQYSNNSDARNLIDLIQTNYQCCGETTWLDWTRVQSGNTTGSTNISAAVSATTLAGSTAATTLAGSTAATMLANVTATTTTTIAQGAAKNIIPTDLRYINMISVSYSTQFSVPVTCCINGGSGSNGSSQPTCSSTSQFYANGCLTSLVKRVNQQNMGIGIINCFMIVLTFVAIPVLVHGYSALDTREKDINTRQLKQIKQSDPKLAPSPLVVSSYH